MMFHETPDLTMVKFETPKTTITAFKVIKLRQTYASAQKLKLDLNQRLAESPVHQAPPGHVLFECPIALHRPHL